MTVTRPASAPTETARRRYTSWDTPTASVSSRGCRGRPRAGEHPDDGEVEQRAADPQEPVLVEPRGARRDRHRHDQGIPAREPAPTSPFTPAITSVQDLRPRQDGVPDGVTDQRGLMPPTRSREASSRSADGLPRSTSVPEMTASAGAASGIWSSARSVSRWLPDEAMTTRCPRRSARRRAGPRRAGDGAGQSAARTRHHGPREHGRRRLARPSPRQRA